MVEAAAEAPLPPVPAEYLPSPPPPEPAPEDLKKKERALRSKIRWWLLRMMVSSFVFFVVISECQDRSRYDRDPWFLPSIYSDYGHHAAEEITNAILEAHNGRLGPHTEQEIAFKIHLRLARFWFLGIVFAGSLVFWGRVRKRLLKVIVGVAAFLLLYEFLWVVAGQVG